MRIFRAADTLIAQARRSPQVQSYPGYTMSSPHHPGIHGPYLKSTSKIKGKKYEKILGEETAGTNYTDSLSM